MKLTDITKIGDIKKGDQLLVVFKSFPETVEAFRVKDVKSNHDIIFSVNAYFNLRMYLDGMSTVLDVKKIDLTPPPNSGDK